MDAPQPTGNAPSQRQRRRFNVPAHLLVFGLIFVPAFIVTKNVEVFDLFIVWVRNQNAWFLDELVSMWVNDMGEPRSELNDFEFSNLNKLLDAQGQQLGWEIEFSDGGGIIGGAVYLANDDQTTVGFGS